MHNPRSDCRKLAHPRCHWTKKKGQWKPKKAFQYWEEAAEFIRVHKYVGYKPYFCEICGCIHIGYEKEQP